MNVLILAGGFATRLYPLTQQYPKALLKVGNKPIIEYLTDELVRTDNVDEIAIISNQRYFKVFEEWLKDKYPNNKIRLISNLVDDPGTRLGAVYDLKFGLDELNWSIHQVMVLASDTVASVKIADLVNFGLQNQNEVINVIYDTKNKDVIKNKLGCVEINDNKIIKFWEKPESPETTLTSVPYYIFPSEAMKLISTFTNLKLKGDSPGHLMAWLMGKYPIKAYKIDKYYYDSNTIEAYNRLNELVINHELEI